MSVLQAWAARLPLRLTRQDRIAYALIAAWLLVMIAFPISVWTLGERVIPTGITIAAIAQALAVLLIVQMQWGWAQALRALLIAGLGTWFAEFVGSHTGFPFGVYHYTEVLQPQLGGVPLLIPIAWFMLLPACWALAQVFVPQRTTWADWLKLAFFSAIFLTAWDLFLDPQMVAWGFWVWAEPSGYFGIPWVNYLGWLLTATLITFAVRPAPLRPMPLGVVYACVWFLQSIGLAVFWGQPGPALFGSLAMGSLMVIAYRRTRQLSA